MANLQIRKKSSRTWLHIDGDLGQFILSKFYFSEDLTKFQIVEQGESRRRIYDIVDVYVYDDTNGGAQETFTNITDLSIRLEQLFYPAFSFANGIPTTTTDVTANHFKGNYDVTTNQPILIDGVGQIGDEYKSSLAGTRNFGSGDIILAVNDILAYNGSNWFLKVNNNQSSGGAGVQSVTGTAVDNTDPFNPIINSTLYFNKTKSEVDTLIASNSLVRGALYIITDKGLYLEAITSNKLATEGYGEFTNPVYTSPTQIYDPATASYDTSEGDAYVIWGGKVWKSKNSSVGAGQNIDNLTLDSTYWQTSAVYAGGTIPIGAILSKKVYDKITYDYANDFISSREDNASNAVKCSFTEFNILVFNPILYFQWGNTANVYANKIYGKLFDIVNQTGSVINNIVTGNLPTTTTAISFLVKQNGQWKEQSSIVPEFADNAAAITGGLTSGLHYRTGDFLKIVH